MNKNKFEELEFQPHNCLIGSIQAVKFFENGFGVSVIQGAYLYGRKEDDTYEVALIKKIGDSDFKLVYLEDTEFVDVVGYCSREKVCELMDFVENLSKNTITE